LPWIGTGRKKKTVERVVDKSVTVKGLLRGRGEGLRKREEREGEPLKKGQY